MVAMRNVMSAAGQQIAEAWEAVAEKDREKYGCRFVRRHERLTMRGDFDEDQCREEAEEIGYRIARDGPTGGARQKDWIAFIEKLIALWVQIAPLFIK